MITEKQFKDAMSIIESYCSQVHKLNKKISSTTEVGCRVKLSSWGLEMQGNQKKNLVGTVLDYLPYVHITDGTVIVKWDRVKKPDYMHISQIEAII